MINDFHMFQSLAPTATIYCLFGKTIFLANNYCTSGSSVRIYNYVYQEVHT